MTACVSSSLTKLTYKLAHFPLRAVAREASVLKTSNVNFRGKSTTPKDGFHHINTPNQKQPGKSNQINTNNSQLSQARSSSQGTNMDRLPYFSHSTLENGSTTEFSSNSPTTMLSNPQSANNRYSESDDANMPVDAVPTSVPVLFVMRVMLQQQPKYKDYFVAPKKLQPAWRAELLSRYVSYRYSALPADAAAGGRTNLLPPKFAAFEHREPNELSAVLKRLRMVGKPHFVPTVHLLKTLLNTFIHAACLTNSYDRNVLVRAHTAEWIAFANQLNKTVQNLFTSKKHAVSDSDITVSNLLDAYSALYHLDFPRKFSSQLDVAFSKISSSLDNLAVALLDKMTFRDALQVAKLHATTSDDRPVQLADWTLRNTCHLTSNFNHRFIKRWFTAFEHFSPSTKHVERHAALPSVEECLRVMFQLTTMRVTAPDNLMAVLERLIVDRSDRRNLTANATNGTPTTPSIPAAKQQADPISLEGMNDIEFAVMCYSFYRTKSRFHLERTFKCVLQRAGRYVEGLSARAASGAAQNYDAELAPEQKLTDEISLFPRFEQQPEITSKTAESIKLDSIVKCILINTKRSNFKIVEPFTSMVRRTLTTVGDKRNNDFLQSVFDIPLLARVAAITCDIGLRDEVLLDLVFKRILTASRERPERLRIKYLAQLLQVYGTLTYVPNDGSNNNDEKQFFSFFGKQIGALVVGSDSEIMKYPELLAQSVWNLAILGYYSRTMIVSLFALLHQHDTSSTRPKYECDYFAGRDSDSRRRHETSLAVLRWCIMLERPDFDWRNIFVKPTIGAAAAAHQNNNNSKQLFAGRRSNHASRSVNKSLRDDAEDDKVDSSSILTSLSEIPDRREWLQLALKPANATSRRELYDALCDNVNELMRPSRKKPNKAGVARLLRLTPYAEPSVVLRVDRASGKLLPFDERVAKMFSTAVDASDLQQLSSPTDTNINLLDDNRDVRHVALIIRAENHYIESVSDGSRHLLGHWRMQERHLRMMGFHPVSIDRSQLHRVYVKNDSVGMTALIRDAIRQAVPGRPRKTRDRGGA